nr:MAG TPA: hypothetical protein [Caudoviricetes sp.]
MLSLRLKCLSFSLFQSTAAGSRRTRCKRLLHPTKIVYRAAQEMSSTIMTMLRPPDMRRSRARSARPLSRKS